jgi:hypothetical protein
MLGIKNCYRIVDIIIVITVLSIIMYSLTQMTVLQTYIQFIF